MSAVDPRRLPGCRCCMSRRGFLSAMAAGAAGFAASSAEAQVAAPVPQPLAPALVIDCHGHYTTEPQALFAWRKRQISALNDPAQTPRPDELRIGDDELRQSVEGAQLKFQRERGTTLTIFSPRASGMGHHIGNAATSLAWSQVSNDLNNRLVTL